MDAVTAVSGSGPAYFFYFTELLAAAGVELSEEGFDKLSAEISLQRVELDCEMPWGRERTTFFLGEAPIGEGLEPILLRQGFVRQLLPEDAREYAVEVGRIGPPGHRAYYEVCTDPQVSEMVQALLVATSSQD